MANNTHYEQILQKIKALNPRHAEVEAVLRELYLETGPNPQADAQVNSAGMIDEPTITDNMDGSVTIGEARCHLYADSIFTPPADIYTIEEKTFILTDVDVNYITVNYNNGNPMYDVTLVVTDIEVSSIIPVNTFFRDGNDVHSLSWDTPGVGLPEKLFNKNVKLTRFQRESGLLPGEEGTRNVTIDAGVAWSGVKRHDLPAFTSASDQFHIRYHVSGGWVSVLETQYNNTHYDDGTDLVAALPNKYLINWVYRDVGDLFTHGDVVLGTAQYPTLDSAKSAQLPEVPEVITTHHILVGRIIVQNGSDTAAAIESAFGTVFLGTGITTARTPIVLSEHSAIPARNAEENIHGALVPLVTGHDLSAGDLTLTGATEQGIGRLIMVVNTASDFAGTITATGTVVDRETGAETGAQVSTMTIDSLTTDGTTTDANGQERHDLTSAYITDKWFTGDVVISSSDTTITDLDVYHCSFEQFNDAPSIRIDALDMNFLCTTATSASLSARLYTVIVTGDAVDITPIAEYVESTFVTGRYYRVRRGDLNVTLDGVTDGIFLTTAYLGSPSKFADAGTKVWASISA